MLHAHIAAALLRSGSWQDDKYISVLMIGSLLRTTLTCR